MSSDCGRDGIGTGSPRPISISTTSDPSTLTSNPNGLPSRTVKSAMTFGYPQICLPASSVKAPSTVMRCTKVPAVPNPRSPRTSDPGGCTITQKENSLYCPRSQSTNRVRRRLTTARPGRSSKTRSPL